MIKNKRLETVLSLIFLAVLYWIVRYWYSRHFGLYEDDLTIIPKAFQVNFSHLIQQIVTDIINNGGQGRPLHHSFIYLFAWLGWQIGGLWGPYWIGYAITVVNISLFYLLLKRVSNASMAILGGLAYILFASNTTQAYLTMSLGYEPSVTFLLLAFHSYLSHRRLLAYFLAFLILFGYETPFLVFLAAPLLSLDWNKRLIRELGFHVLAMALMIVLVYSLRIATIGAGGVLDLTIGQMITTALLHMGQGPLVDLGTYLYRPLQVIQSRSLGLGIVLLLAAGALLWVLTRIKMPARVGIGDLWRALRDRAARRALPREVTTTIQLLLIGLVMLLMAYPLTFTVRAYAISGRDTRVHAAAAEGAAIVIASIILLLIYMTSGKWGRRIVNLLVSVELALMTAYGFVIQRDYNLAWQYQREFWTELVPLIPDAGSGTLILVDPAALQDTRQIGANYWNLPRVLNQIYTFPDDFQQIPTVHRLEKGWQNSLFAPDGRIQINGVTVYSVPGYYGEYDPNQVILIQAEGGHLVRRTSLSIEGKSHSLKPVADPILPSLPHGFLYNLLIVQP